MPKKGVIIGYLVFVVLAVFLYFVFQQTQPTGSNQETVVFEIEKGEGLSEIAQKLESQELIKNNKLFQAYSFLRNVRSQFWPGEYKVSQGMSLKEIISVLTSQPLAREKQVVLIEGWTAKEIAEEIERVGLVEKQDFLRALGEIGKSFELEEKYLFLADRPVGADIEGYLFPDTYRFFESTTSQAIIEKILDNFQQKLNSLQLERSDYSLFEILTMASLIEKEAALDQDRRLVSGVFWDRMEAGWALQSCATINYILGEPKERLSYEDTRIPSPYNTYLNPGLPPSPINNPGLSSIQAALNPLESDYCCFLSTSKGQIIFSQTIEEHNINKAKYLK